MISPAHDLRSRECRCTLEEEDEEGRKDGEGRRKDDNDLRWDNCGDGIDEDGVVSRDEGCDIWDEKDACRDGAGRGG